MSVLSTTCTCGFTLALKLPDLSRMDDAFAVLAAEGWGLDERGMNRCSACMKNEPAKEPQRQAKQEPRQLSLLEADEA